MTIKRLTPVLLAEDVEACIEFWKSFGLEATVSVPHGDQVGFVILHADQVELMYQSFASARADHPEAIEGVQRSVIYLEVDSLDEILDSIQAMEVVVPEHTTFYGAREIYVRDPAGHLVGFSEHPQPAQDGSSK